MRTGSKSNLVFLLIRYEKYKTEISHIVLSCMLAGTLSRPAKRIRKERLVEKLYVLVPKLGDNLRPLP